MEEERDEEILTDLEVILSNYDIDMGNMKSYVRLLNELEEYVRKYTPKPYT